MWTITLFFLPLRPSRRVSQDIYIQLFPRVTVSQIGIRISGRSKLLSVTRSLLDIINMAIAPPLNVGWGYGIVLGLGAVFAFGMVSLYFTWETCPSTDVLRSSSPGSSNDITMNSKPQKCLAQLEGQ